MNKYDMILHSEKKKELWDHMRCYTDEGMNLVGLGKDSSTVRNTFNPKQQQAYNRRDRRTILEKQGG